MQAQNNRSRRAALSATLAVAVALICMATLWLIDFNSKSGVHHSKINMITQAVLDRAGATALPTEKSQPPRR